MPTIKAQAPSSATLRPVIVRACVKCGGKRQLDTPCADCGNPDAPVVHDLGIQAAYYKNPLKQLWWETVGQRLAARRAAKANKYVEK